MLFKKPLRTLLLSLVAVCAVFGASAQSAKISLHTRYVTAGELIRTIKSQTGYNIAYNKNLFDTSREVTLPATRLSIREALDCMVAGVDAKYIVGDRFIAFVPAADNSRPQVRNEEPRTADAYTRSNPNADNGARQTPAAETPTMKPATTSVTATATAEPAAPLHSDYTPVALYSGVQTSLPRFALKINLLYGLATLTPNLAFEFGLARRWTMEAAYSNNPWNYKSVDKRKLTHGIARIEARYWFCERFSGHFIGVHALYSEYKVNALNIPLLFSKEYRYHGNAWGGGVNYGYDLPIGKRWNLEFTAGLGIYRMKYDRYACSTCDREATPMQKTWVGPSRLGVTLMFLIK
jgi:hypothetical protein